MGQDYDVVARMWVNGEAPKKTYFGKCESRYRMSYGVRPPTEDLLSYEHFTLATKLPSGHILINGDTYSNTTTVQQTATRSAVQKSGKPWAIIPFSALQAASVSPRNITVIEMTADRHVKVWRKMTERQLESLAYYQENDTVRQTESGGWELQGTEHFLGETVFSANGRVYVCGLDRNDDIRKRHFFLAQLPESRRKPKTVEEALAMLRPKTVPEGALRQGEWFFLPTDQGFRPDLKKGELLRKARGTWNDTVKFGVPIEHDKGAALRAVNKSMAHYKTSEQGPEVVVTNRMGRHVATRMYVNGHVYVQGRVRDQQHSTLVLGDGKTWYRVVKNLATGSWSASGRVD